MANKIIDPGEEFGQVEGDIECRKRLGGMLRYYHRKAAWPIGLVPLRRYARVAKNCRVSPDDGAHQVLAPAEIRLANEFKTHLPRSLRVR